MELDLILGMSTVLAGVTCIVYCRTVNGKIPFLKQDLLKYFYTTIISGVIGLVCGGVGTVFMLSVTSLDFLLPLVSVGTALGTVLFVRTFAKKTVDCWSVKGTMLASSLFALALVSAFEGESSDEFLLGAVLFLVIYVSFALLIYGTSAFSVHDTNSKGEKMYPKIIILTSSIGFAAEGFKGIFENPRS